MHIPSWIAHEFTANVVASYIPKPIQYGVLILIISLPTVLACSHRERASQWMKVPDTISKPYTSNTAKQSGARQKRCKFFDLEQFPQHVFGYHIIPCLQGGDIHNLILTSKSLRNALWAELPFLFKQEERAQRLRQYLINPECLIPIAAICLRRYMFSRYPSIVDTSTEVFSSTSVLHKKAKMIDLLAIKSNLFIQFLDRFRETAASVYNGMSQLAFSKCYQHFLPDVLAYSKARLLAPIYNFLSFPTVLETLRIPRDTRACNNIQRAICDHLAVLAPLQDKYADDKQRQSAQKLFQAILVAGGNSWMSRFSFVEMASYYRSSFLNYDATCGSIAVAKRLIQCGANVNRRDPNGHAPLHYAARYGHLGVVECFLANSARINQPDRWRKTPLTWAARHGRLSAVNSLIAHGAEVDHSDNTERTPLHYACRYGHLATARLLLKQGASIHKKDFHGNSMLHLAVRGNAPNIAKLLIKNGADLDAQDYRGATPLHLSADHRQRKSIIRLLLTSNADINVRDNHGATPLIRTLYRAPNLQAAELLIAYGADVNVPYPTGTTLLQQFEYALEKAQKAVWHDIMGYPPYDSEQAKYVHFLAKMHNIPPSFQPSFCSLYAPLPWLSPILCEHLYRLYCFVCLKPSCCTRFPPLTISPQEILLVLSQYSQTHIRQVFGDKVFDETKWALLCQQITTLLKKPVALQM